MYDEACRSKDSDVLSEALEDKGWPVGNAILIKLDNCMVRLPGVGSAGKGTGGGGV